MKTRIMYIENKSNELIGEARIGRVIFSKTGSSIHYKGRTFKSLKGAGAASKSNYIDSETGQELWISGCKKDGTDRLYGERLPIYIDEDVQVEYWTEIRNNPRMVGTLRIN